MRNTWKRMTAMLLAVLMFVCAVPLTVFATGEAPVTEYYDFAVKQKYAELKGGTFSIDDADNAAFLKEKYDAGELNWLYEGRQNGRKETDGSGNEVSTFTQAAYQSGHVQFNATYGFNWWVAIRIRAPKTGTYDMTFNTATVTSGGVQKHSMWTETYFFDAADIDAGTATVNDKLVEDNKINKFAPTSANPNAFVGNVAVEEGKEYLVVLRMVFKHYGEADGDGLRTSNLYLNGLTMVEADPPVPPSTGYNFDLATNYPDVFFNNDTIASKKEKINTYYEKGYIDWKIEEYGLAVAGATGTMDKEYLMKGMGIYCYTSGYDWYYAIRFRAPGNGYHKVTVDTGLGSVVSGGETIYKHSIWTDAYMLDAASIDNGSATIVDSLLKRNKLSNMFAPTVEKPDADVGYYNFTAGKEYILVLRQTKSSYNSGKETGLTTTNLYLKGLSFKAEPGYVPPAVDNTKVVYDFDLGDSKTGIYPNNTMLNDKMDDLKRLYDLGEINWYVQEPVSGGGKLSNGSGVTMYSNADEYAAFRIKSPGPGTYTLTMKHATFGRGAMAALYILPADTTNIVEALDTHRRVGLMRFYNDNGELVVKDGLTSLAGTWEFGDEEEYIVVLEAFGKSPYTSEAYMYFSQLICEKGDVTANYPQEKKANSIVVAQHAVKINHSSIMNATAEINGYDYFFMPQEGKSMSVYNLDTGEFVSQLATPFTSCRGIAVDPDGYVWLVGDNSYIFRYDPYLDIGESVYYYKHGTNQPDNLGGVYGSSSAFGLVYGDGDLYFGVFGNDGWLVKYNIASGVFTRMGMYGCDDTNDYVACPVYDNGIVYATIAGDSNGDGKKSFDLVKVDAKTCELLERLDITPYVSQKEVMLRGMGICGGVLLIGGDTNDVANALAVDTTGEKMEILDLGISGFINYYPTKEIDGACYFLAQGRGMWKFDSATKTATQVKGLDIATVSFRTNRDVTMTMENDAKFPGLSYVAFRGSNNMPTIYNMETGTLKVIDNMILDEYGNGQELRSIIKGFGENEIYMGAYRTNACSVFNTVEGKITHEYEANSSQTDFMYMYEGKLYAGNYNAAVLTQINLDDERRNVPLLSLKSIYEQARIHAITGGGGYIFCGSVPDQYKYGGCLAWVNLETFEKVVMRNVVEDQSIVSLVYNDGLIYAGSCTTPGTSAAAKPELTAKIVIYDVARGEKGRLIEIDPHDYIDGLPEKISGFDAMFVDPNVQENGKIWVQMGARLLCLKYNKATNKVTLTEELCFDAANTGGGWHPFAPYIDGNYAYIGFGQKGGLRKVNLLDVNDNVQIPVPGNKMFTIADDGCVYYANMGSLMMYPLNVTDADWAIAGKVDDMIADLGKITLASEPAVKAARAAYDALGNKHKALIQNIYDLEAAENDLLECKIDSIGEVTMEDGALINEIRVTYKALSVKNRSYVKNYTTVFAEALKQYNAIVDSAEAAKVQKLIDGIQNMGKITLEKEDAIKAIRAEYDKLTKPQRDLVNAKALLDAEAIIKALRLEKVEYLKQLIASIGEVTLEDEPVIDEAVALYEWLYVDERMLVDYETLNLAKNQLKKLQKEKAAEVDALIAQIGDEITLDSKDAIEAARKAYDALTPGAKKLVKSLQQLLDAEAIYAELVKERTTMIIVIVVAAVVVVAAAATVTVLIIRKKKNAAPAAETEETAETPAEPEA